MRRSPNQLPALSRDLPPVSAERAHELRHITDRYSNSDHRNRETAAEAHYDNMREHGFPADRSRADSKAAAEQQIAILDRAADKLAGSTGKIATVTESGRRNPFRVRYPWEAPEAGITLDKDDRGT